MMKTLKYMERLEIWVGKTNQKSFCLCKTWFFERNRWLFFLLWTM